MHNASRVRRESVPHPTRCGCPGPFSLPQWADRATKGRNSQEPREFLDMVAARRTGSLGALSTDQARRDSDPWAMIDVFPLATFICGPDARLLRYNRRAEELWGIAPQMDGQIGRASCRERVEMAGEREIWTITGT